MQKAGTGHKTIKIQEDMIMADTIGHLYGRGIKGRFARARHHFGCEKGIGRGMISLYYSPNESVAA